MRHGATILIVLATLIVAPSAAADAIFTEQPSLTSAAGAVPGQLTETGAVGPARVFCWNAEAWLSAGWDGLTDGFYDGFNNLPRSICRPLLRSVARWQPRLVDNRFLLGYAAFILGHEAAHAAGGTTTTRTVRHPPTASRRPTSGRFSAGSVKRHGRPGASSAS